MRARHLCFCVLALLGSVVNAQQALTRLKESAIPTPDSQAAILLNRVFRVVTAGGLPISDVTIRGTVERTTGLNHEEGTAVLSALRTGESKIEFSFPSGDLREIHAISPNGPVGYWSGADGVLHPLSTSNILVDSAWFAPALMLRKLAESPDTVASASNPETHGGIASQHLSVSSHFPQAPKSVSSLMQLHSRMEIYFDASSLLPNALEFNAHPDKDASRDIPVEIKYSDFRAVQGITTPFHIQQYMNGGLILDLEILTVDVNRGISKSSFSVPEGTAIAPAVGTVR
jgi:hypothetical protein